MKEAKVFRIWFRTVRKQFILLLSHFIILSYSLSIYAQSNASTQIKKQLAGYFQNYTTTAYSSNDPIRLLNVVMNDTARCITLSVNAGFASQPFTPETVRQIYSSVEQFIPQSYSTYKIQILANGVPIEQLVPIAWNDTCAQNRQWGNVDHRDNPWVTRLSQPVEINRGLSGRHLAVWASHGHYFDSSKGFWKWQRPRIYCTTEDIFTQSFVYPFLIPMLENAGAVVFTPRERDWQRHEVIVDNDINSPDATYTETNGTNEWTQAGTGFCKLQDIYFDGENPFTAGTARMAEAQSQSRRASQIMWMPRLPATGRYAVYVSYVSLPTSVSDAEYTVRHQGIETRFRVNQQMGGSTWVYLGTFDFDAGSSAGNCVTLSNQSSEHGMVTADAVRFGGGMGSISRGDDNHAFVRSGLPRFLEGSRYYAQWAGMPYALYKNKEGVNDYAEDINVRSLMTNRLARGSVYLPGDSGLCVPLELSLAVHSDAGYRQDSTHIGTLGIYTTGQHTTTSEIFEGPLAEGLLPIGRSRLMSRDLCDRIMTQVDNDIRQVYDNWNRRQMHDRNYSETRMPQVPSIILETLSHQNWADMMRGHDPSFKMLLSRAIYKGILNYMASAHGCPPLVVQPQPVGNFAAVLTATGDSAHLSWHATMNGNEPTAMPKGFIVYTSEGEQGYDNGKVVYGTQVAVPVRKGTLTRYQIRAFNEGGVSLPSEELCVYSAPRERNRLLIVNGFQRLAGPQPIDNDSLRGFDFTIDPGVVYQHSPSYCGQQMNLYKGTGEDFGQSGDELEGMLIAGNTFDFTTQHARDFLIADKTTSISSCSAGALPNESCTNYQVIDLILGAQREDGYSLSSAPALPPRICQAIHDFTQRGGALLLSGAYINEGVDVDFAANVLHFIPNGPYELNEYTCHLSGMNTHFSIYNEPNEERYSVRRLSQINPMPDAFTSIISQHVASSLAVAYQGSSYRSLTYGFPLECIRESAIRQAIMAASLAFLLNK